MTYHRRPTVAEPRRGTFHPDSRHCASARCPSGALITSMRTSARPAVCGHLGRSFLDRGHGAPDLGERVAVLVRCTPRGHDRLLRRLSQCGRHGSGHGARGSVCRSPDRHSSGWLLQTVATEKQANGWRGDYLQISKCGGYRLARGANGRMIEVWSRTGASHIAWHPLCHENAIPELVICPLVVPRSRRTTACQGLRPAVTRTTSANAQTPCAC
jgi:hypothetical protein